MEKNRPQWLYLGGCFGTISISLAGVRKEWVWMSEILDRARILYEGMVRDRRRLHGCPEVGLELWETSRYVGERLDEMGIRWRECGGAFPDEIRKKYRDAGFPDMKVSTGIVAEIGQGSPCILLRADMDGLPMREETGLPFCSTNGAGHMCGHDMHTAMLLGAAQILKEREEFLEGTVKLMFQPGEEIGIGSKTMLDDGILETPRVDAAMALHVQSQTETGQVTFCTGTATASLDTFLVEIKGKGGHSSRPDETTDALMIANQIYQAVNLLPGRETDPSATVTLTCGVMKAGTAVNIIPETAALQIGMRTLERRAREHMVCRIPEIIENYTKAWRASCEITAFATPNTWVDPKLTGEMLPFAEEVAGEDRVREAAPFSGTEDFGYISEKVPSVFFFLGAGSPQNYPMHSPHMVLDEEILPLGAALYANCALRWLESEKERKTSK